MSHHHPLAAPLTMTIRYFISLSAYLRLFN